MEHKLSVLSLKSVYLLKLVTIMGLDLIMPWSCKYVLVCVLLSRAIKEITTSEEGWRWGS